MFKHSNSNTTRADYYAGQTLRSIRKARNITQVEMGKALGMSFQQVQKYESGKNRMAVSTLDDICRFLEVSPTLFFKDHGMDNTLFARFQENDKKIIQIKRIVGEL